MTKDEQHEQLKEKIIETLKEEILRRLDDYDRVPIDSCDIQSIEASEDKIKFDVDYKATQADMLIAKNALIYLICETRGGSLKDNPAAIRTLPDAVRVLASYFF